MSSSRFRWDLLRKPEFGLLLANVVVYVAVLMLDPLHNFRSPDSLQLIITQTSLLSIFAIGSALVIISGGIDLSVGSVIAFSSVIVAVVIRQVAPDAMIAKTAVGFPAITAGIFAVILTSLLIGALHAALITQLNLPPFIATLGTLIGLRSLGRIIAQHFVRSDKVSMGSPDFRLMHTSTWSVHLFGTEIPIRWISLLIFLAVVIVMSLLLNKTVWGRHVYALGGNEQAARLSGIRTNRLKLSVYCLGSLLAGIAGILYTALEGQGNSQSMAVGYELNAIAAAVVGGCSLRGGVGSVLGTVLGALFLVLVVNGIPMVIKIDSSLYEGLIVGGVVILAVTVNQFRQSGHRI